MNKIGDSQDADYKTSNSTSVDLAGRAIEDLSNISKSLNADLINNNGLFNTLKTKLGRIEKSAKISVEYVTGGEVVFMDYRKGILFYRIVGEALDNILKHANASIINLKMNYSETRLSIVIIDDGKGFDQGQVEKAGVETLSAGLNTICEQWQN